MQRVAALVLSLCLRAGAGGARVRAGRTARVGYLSWQDAGPVLRTTLAGFVQGLREEGYVEGRNLDADPALGVQCDPERFKPLARELARRQGRRVLRAGHADGHRRLVRRPQHADRRRHDPRPGRARVRQVARAAGHARHRRDDDEQRAHRQAPAVADGDRAGPASAWAWSSTRRCATRASRRSTTTERGRQELGLTLVIVHVDRPEMSMPAFRKLADAEACRPS